MSKRIRLIQILLFLKRRALLLVCNIYSIAKPISEIEHPAITICSQGWIPIVIEDAIKRQFHSYAESKGLDISNMTNSEREETEKLMMSGNN